MRVLAPVVLLAVLTFGGAGILHDLIPHDHIEDSPTAFAVWQNIHATLGHEEKRTPDARLAVYELGNTDSNEKTARIALIDAAELSPPKQETLLRKGVLAYRRFG